MLHTRTHIRSQTNPYMHTYIHVHKQGFPHCVYVMSYRVILNEVCWGICCWSCCCSMLCCGAFFVWKAL